jgi:hypothetical protein
LTELKKKALGGNLALLGFVNPFSCSVSFVYCPMAQVRFVCKTLPLTDLGVRFEDRKLWPGRVQKGNRGGKSYLGERGL